MEQHDTEPRNDLPPEVERLAIRLGAAAETPPSTIRIHQHGRMRQDGASAWMKFRASQIISIRSCGFDWRARMSPLGLIRVRDTFSDGEGTLDVRLLGLVPIAHTGGTEEVARGELMRYLAELPWAPDAILWNRALQWRIDAPGRIAVSVGALKAEVFLELNPEGLIGGISAPARPRSLGKSFVPTPWLGRFSDYRSHAGRLIPFAGEVGWRVGGKEDICWQGQIEDWRADA
jgi:hypothetical protein